MQHRPLENLVPESRTYRRVLARIKRKLTEAIADGDEARMRKYWFEFKKLTGEYD